ncbi:MAG: amino acid adenylation domain-containing protein [Desulfococcaceae bacterium]|jgi:amino acid adenylation domain-containing protein|nr:amino acid adenylation domain-containing protein [Desulfococcaceae bacterium]
MVKKMTELDKRIAALSPEKRRLLELRLAEAGISGKKTIPNRSLSQYPLSFIQRRLWFIQQMDPGAAVFNMPRLYRIQGNLHIPALEQALNALISRHETLRTVIIPEDGKPLAAVPDKWSFALPVRDLRSLPEHSRETEITRLTEEEIQRPFDLSKDIMMRGLVLRTGDSEYLVLIVSHHLASDFWSAGIRDREIGLFYEAFSQGLTPQLPQLPISYGDFAVWQQEQMNSPETEKQAAYWHRQLAGELPVLELPADRPRPVMQTYPGERKSVLLPQNIVGELESMSRRENATLFMTLLTAFQILLFRYTAQTDLIVGSPAAGRVRAETEGLIGCFLNTLVFRSRLSGNPTFRDLLKQVRRTTLDAYANQDIPFEILVESLKVPRVPSRTPIFQVMIDYLNIPAQPLKLRNLHVVPVETDNRSSMTDLILYLRPVPEGLHVTAEYNRDLFDPETVRRFLSHFRILLEGIVANPDQGIADLPMLSESGQQRILAEWSHTDTAELPDKCLHELFAEQARRTPDAPALIFGDRQIPYRQLKRMADAGARYLMRSGISAGTPIGICMERSPRMVTAVLAVLKSGGICLPLDPSYPRKRLEFMLSDAQVPLVLTEKKHKEKIPGTKSLCFEDIVRQAARNPEIPGQRTILSGNAGGLNWSVSIADDPLPSRSPEDPAYIMYTSGSTGQPKGVIIPHRQILNRVFWNLKTFPYEPGETACMKTPLNFVDSILEIFAPLLSGIPAVIISDEDVREVRKFVEILGNHRIRQLLLVPSLLKVMLELFPDLRSRLPHLTYWISSGEALPKKLVLDFREKMPGAHLCNVYGASEAWDVSFYRCGDENSHLSGIPIGRPLSNMKTYILDEHLNPVPAGVPGMLYVSGAGLSRGYYRQADLTAEKFVPDPFSPEPESRLYKTGDLARWLPDGNMEYLGRKDHQVKIRGMRIETGEIESVLAQHPEIKESVVLCREKQGDKYLATYTVFHDREKPLSAAKLKAFLRQKLPEYMIPSVFVTLETMPLNPSGKTDRKALPEPAPERVGSDFTAPRNAVELELVRIWEKFLDIRPIGVQHDFFALGGHSLLAVQIFAEMEKVMGINLPVVSLFQSPTIEGLARMIQEKDTVPWCALVPMQAGGAAPPVFYVPPLAMTLVSVVNLLKYLGTDQPFYGLQPKGIDRDEPPHDRVEEMAAYYLKEIRQVQPQGPYFLIGQCFGAHIAFEMALQLKKQGQETAFLGIIDSLREPGFIYKDKVRHAGEKGIDPGSLRMQIPERPRSFATFAPEHLRERVDRTENAHFRAMEFYNPENIRPCKITFFWAENTAGDRTSLRSEWTQLSEGEAEIFFVPGNHNTVIQEPHVRVLAEKLKDCLQRAAGTPAVS